MYSNLPKRQRRLIKFTLAASWLLAGAGGVAAIVVSPNTLVAELGRFVAFGWGGVVAMSSLVATAGVLFKHYRWEWWASWFTAAGIVPYVGTVWWLVAAGETARLTHAFLVTSLMGFFILRALLCAAHAARLRALHGEVSGSDDDT